MLSKPPRSLLRRPLPPEDSSSDPSTTPEPSREFKRIASSVDKGHGREEKRTLRTTTVLTMTQKWAGLRQAFELRREHKVAGKTTVETIYGITSLPPEKADAIALLRIIRDHWKIENCLHYVRDVTLREDACRVRMGSPPQVLAALRNAVIHLLSTVNAVSRPAAIEQLQIDIPQAIKLIGVAQNR